jgi:FtsH-binding integral membrane protein
MEQNPETIQYQQGGYAPYVDNKPGEPMLQPPLDNNYQTTGNYNQLEMKNGGGIQEEDLIINYMVRRGFIIKTYGILISQLALTTIFICLSFIKAINDFIKDSDFIRSTFFIAFCSIFVVVTITVIVVFMCCRDTARKFPINYILLFSFTLCMSFYLLIFCSFFETKDVIVALILTVAVTVGLTIYAIRTKTDFTFCGGFLFAFAFLMVFTVAFYFWIRVTVFWIMIGIFIYSLYIIYDTQLIIGKVGCEYNIDDYCLAALNLYIDIIYLFIKILQLIGGHK